MPGLNPFQGTQGTDGIKWKLRNITEIAENVDVIYKNQGCRTHRKGNYAAMFWCVSHTHKSKNENTPSMSGQAL